MASISERESREVEAANASGTTPVVFIHGLWLLPSSWANWADFFKRAGYAPLTPDWPDDPETVEDARANPDVLAKKTLKQVWRRADLGCAQQTPGRVDSRHPRGARPARFHARWKPPRRRHRWWFCHALCCQPR
jgi:hypothetical protein